MKPLDQLCKPRKSVFDPARRDTVHNLSHLAGERIDAPLFFEKNYVTEGMRVLLTEAFRRLAGKSEQAVFKLTQAMGGGKTHNLICLGMLAKHPEYRAQVLAGLPSAKALPNVRVVAFSGRETDVPHGIWGDIALQLGKEHAFAEYCAPLKAPGRTAWTNLLKGEPTLILLDELAPYLDNARSIAVGASDLSHVTATALTNLFEAVGEADLGNVCVVLADLVGTYAEASAQIASLLHTLQSEAQRRSMDLTPVQMNTDEFYHILRKRLFESLPPPQAIADVAQGYGEAIRKAKQMDITAQSPEQFAQLIESSYPFHPAIKDLYARFRENPGFQQTRALIRLMRIIVSRMWNSGEAQKKFLVSAHDIDLNDAETLSEIRQINPTLENAVAHDIANQHRSVAEVMDQNLGTTDTTEACRLIFMASLANVQNAVLGLSVPEIIAYLCAPGRDVTRLKTEVLEKLSTAAWYLHSNRDGKLFFRNVENLIARLESMARGYVRDTAIKELRTRLQELFEPTQKDCYQHVLALPAIDEIEPSPDKVTLVISEPYAGQGLNPELQTFFGQETYKNRVGCLTGARNTFESLVENAKRVKAIRTIIDEMTADKLPPSDPQSLQADELRDRILTQFLSAVKETFSTLYYPTRYQDQDRLLPADFLMKYDGNEYNGEDQVRQVLRDRQKFTDDVSSDIFRKKVEQRLFTVPVMLWADIERRAAMNTQWQWHRRDALVAMRDDCVHKELWRADQGGYVDRTPPPPKKTAVQIQERSRDDDTGMVQLKVTPIHGDTVFAEIGGEATTASKKVENGLFDSDEIEVSFLAVDSTGKEDTGPPVTWRNRVTLKYRSFTGNDGSRMLELRAAPNKHGATTIRYSTDGSDPKIAGGTYDEPFAIPPGTHLVLAQATCGPVDSERLQVPIDWKKEAEEKPIDPDRPVRWKRLQQYQTTLEAYAFIDRVAARSARALGVKVTVVGQQWAELLLHPEIQMSAERLREAAELLRKLPEGGQLAIDAAELRFDRGQALLDWLIEAKLQVKPGEVIQ